MKIIVTQHSVYIDDPLDTTSLSVRSAIEDEELSDAVSSSGLGSVDEDGVHVWITTSALIELGRAVGLGQKWETEIFRMFDYAGSRGWLDDTGRVRAHTELLGEDH